MEIDLNKIEAEGGGGEKTCQLIWIKIRGEKFRYERHRIVRAVRQQATVHSITYSFGCMTYNTTKRTAGIQIVNIIYNYARLI